MRKTDGHKFGPPIKKIKGIASLKKKKRKKKGSLKSRSFFKVKKLLTKAKLSLCFTIFLFKKKALSE